MVMLSPSLHKHLVWFLDEESLEPNVFLFVVGLYMDGFPLLKGVSAFMCSLVLANLAQLMQMPDFHFPNFFVKDGENSPPAWLFIRDAEKVCSKLEAEDICLDFHRPDNLLVPHTTIKLQGPKTIRLKFFAKGDSKMKLQLNGSLSANMRYCAPESAFSSEQQADPAVKVTNENFRTFQQKIECFLDMQKVVLKQNELYEVAKAKIYENKKLTAQQRVQRVESLQKKHRKAINDAAARMRTSIIHERPVEFAHWFPPCLLHMRTIEKGRFLKKVKNVACSLTMAHNLLIKLFSTRTPHLLRRLVSMKQYPTSFIAPKSLSAMVCSSAEAYWCRCHKLLSVFQILF